MFSIKKHMRWLALCPLLLAVLLSCRSVSRGPVLALAQDSINLGTVSYRTTRVVDYDLTIKNKGDADLVITDMTPDCPCTTVEAESTTIAAGKSTTIHVKIEFKLPDSLPFEKKLQISTNEPGDISHIVTFYGTTDYQVPEPSNPRYRKNKR